MLPLFMDECQVCGALEERVFEDSWTGLELCNMCLSEVINDVTMSPASEGDNLIPLLKDRCDFEPSEYHLSLM
jgi:hypothetical protein